MHVYHLEDLEDDSSLVMVYANPAAHEFTGIPSEEVVGKTLDENFPRLREKSIPQLYAEIARGGKAQEVQENLYCDERVIADTFTIKVFPLPGDMVGVAFEKITERIKIEKALKDSDSKYRQLFQEMTSGFALYEIICDDNDNPIDYRFLEVNPTFENLTTLKARKLIGKTINEVLPNLEDKFIDKFGQVAISGKSIQFETYSKDIDRYFEVTAYCPMIGLFATIFNDITTTKRLHDFAQKAQRLEIAGRIAGQVAHDFNNLMGPMIAYPEFIRDELPPDHSALPFLLGIEKAANRMSEMNQELLTLGRRGHYNINTLNINEVLNLLLLNMEIPEYIKLDINFDRNLMNIKGGSSQLDRTFNNIITNALDAMDKDGKLEIITENYYVEKSTVRVGHVPIGEYVKVTIKDNGSGIPPDALPKILDPFFTTKSSDNKRGSGLGLSVVHAVIEDHQGHFDIESKVDVGTSFYIYLPITRENTPKIDTESLVGGTESVLVVDDDETQREVSKNLLDKLGYQADAVDSGESAVEYLTQKSSDLVVLDMIMPGGIDGTETYQKILQINPVQKAIIVSGYAETKRVNEALDLGAGSFIKKPLTLKSLAKAVRTELDRKNRVIQEV